MDLKKVGLQQAAMELEQLCSELDELENIQPLIDQLFKERKETLEEAVNRRIRYLMYLDSQIDYAKKMRDLWSSRLAVIEATKSRVSDNTKQIVAACDGLRFKTDLGELRIQKNAIKTLVLKGSLATYDGKFVNDVPGYYMQYMDSGYKLNKTVIRERLDAGETIPEAELIQGSHLKVRI